MTDPSTREAVPRQRHGLAESVEAASLAIPFRLKVAVVWVVIFVAHGWMMPVVLGAVMARSSVYLVSRPTA